MTKHFHLEAKSFLNRAIKMRKMMIKKGVSQVTNAGQVVDKLDALLKHWPYNTNRTMASFVHRHRAEIAYILPGISSRAGRTYMDQFQAIVAASESILDLKHDAVY